jgi:2-iminobutanoate/2-iminopropanoate deaminase
MLRHVASSFSPTFSDAVVVEMGEFDMIFVSGQVGMGPDGKITSGGFAAEADSCFANVRGALERCGASMDQVVRITAYLTDLADYAAYGQARGRAFPASPPASATVQVAGLLVGARVEVDAVAVRRR